MLTQTAQALQIGVSLKIEMIGSVGVSRHANIHDHQVYTTSKLGKCT